MTAPQPKSIAVRIVVAWTLVLIPLGWGVYQSVVKSMPLFRSTGAHK